VNPDETHQGLIAAGVTFAEGLSESELQRVEDQYGFAFPPDLRAFLARALPISKGWVNWRTEEPQAIRAWLRFPLEGICFDIEQNDFWHQDWGPRPAALADALVRATAAVGRAPVLIPIRGHRYLPSTPAEAGNPVFSVHQTDIIHYGTNLDDFWRNEFSYAFGRSGYQITGEPRRIPFWSDLTG